MSTVVSAKNMGQEHGEMQHLGSPILSKIQQAFMYIRSIALGKAHEQFSSFRVVDGVRKSSLHIGWDKAQARLVISAKLIPDSLSLINEMKAGKLESAPWLSHLAAGAQIETHCLSVFESFIKAGNGRSGLKAAIDDMTGNIAPRRIVCVGFCIGGSLATVVATWAAVQWPTADVRCISFGSPAVGNHAFTVAFKWLVGISYRVMFRRDPIPAQSTEQAKQALKHVHGAVYICGEGVRPGNQPKASYAHADYADHSAQAYMGALNVNCKRQLDREKSTGGPCRAKLGSNCVFKCPMEACKRRRAEKAARAAAAVGAQVDSMQPESPAAEPPPTASALMPQLSMRESISSIDDSQDGDMDLSQESTSLTSYVRAGMGSLVTDTASLSKAAFSSTARAFRKLGTRSAHSTTSEHVAAELVSVNSESNLDRAMYGAKYDEDIAAGRIPLSSALNPAKAFDNVPADAAPTHLLAQQQNCEDIFACQLQNAMGQRGVDVDQNLQQGCVSEAKGMFHKLMVQKGLDTEDSELYKQSLPELVRMTPDAVTATTDSMPQPSHSDQAVAAFADPFAANETFASSDKPQQSFDLNQGSPGSSYRGESTARAAYGGEAGEQWVGSQSPDQVATAGVAVAAENKAAAQAPDAGALQRLEEGVSGQDGPDRNSLEQDDASQDHPSAPRLTRQFSLADRDSEGIDQKDLHNLQKVLVVGKISQAAILAAAAYRNHETFKRQTGIKNCRLIYDREHHDTKVHVAWLEGGTAIFAFRGTASKQDGLQDVKIFSRNVDYLQELYPGVKAHLGFLQQFAAVCHPDRAETNMAAVLKELSGGETPNRVICCGHSLGGALATLGAAWAALEYPDADIRCITFGSPRVANKVFGKAFNALVGTSLRLVHGFDPVPSLPPSLLYKHVPGVIHIKRDDLLLKHRPWHTMLRSCISDHGMLKYSSGVYKHMPGGLESLPSFFAPKPVAKLCENICKVTKRGKVASEQTPDEVADASTKSESPKTQDRFSSKPTHVKAGAFLACWGSGDMDAPDSAVSRKSVEQTDSNVARSAIPA